MSDVCNEVEKFGKGIGNTTRYRIIETLFSGERTVNELVKETGFSQSLVSQHLRILRESNLVQDTRRGQEVFYALHSEHMLKLLERLTQELQPPQTHKKV